MIVLFWRNLQCLSAGKKLSSFLTFSLAYCKNIVKLLLWILWSCLATYTLSNTIMFYVYRQAENQLYPHAFWRYCKDMQTYFGYFRYAWLHSPKMIVPACRSMQKINLSFTSFLRFYSIKNPGIWLDDSILAHNSGILPDMVAKYQ